MLDWLKEILGDSYTEEIDGKVATAIGKNFVSRDDFNELNATKKELDKKVRNLEKVNPDELQAQVASLTKENKDITDKYEARILASERSNALTSAINTAGARNAKAILALLDNDKIIYKDGQIAGLNEQLESLKKSDAYLFEKDNKPPAGGVNPSGGASPATTDGNARMNNMIRGAAGKQV